MDTPHDATDRTGDDPQGSAAERDRQEQERARVAADRFAEDLVARGEAVPAGTPLPPGATHEIEEGEDGERTLRRQRFSLH
ncbi:hypothetical protein GCM10010124_33300 [Pilimelia terevasa]|uniref:Uncharacterized protein n=1 Tax=Pilimelia terevasa TaxID=53372 RepID=A0A8J3FL48_9ACTN|nr:hypothetical protein [Pilimelia terevasa]GGK37833.1 hypothetical protein GCM10010124_33300 [Pilimelia terevasa]